MSRKVEGKKERARGRERMKGVDEGQEMKSGVQDLKGEWLRRLGGRWRRKAKGSRKKSGRWA